MYAEIRNGLFITEELHFDAESPAFMEREMPNLCVYASKSFMAVLKHKNLTGLHPNPHKSFLKQSLVIHAHLNPLTAFL